MLKRTARSILSALVLASGVIGAGSVLSLPAGAIAAVSQDNAEKLISGNLSTIVNIRFILKLDAGPQGSQDIDAEITGLMIDKNGLVLVSNTEIGGFAARFNATATPTEIKVLVGDDQEGVKATVLARDSELDLAWIKIEAPDAKGYSALDIPGAATVKMGDELLTLERMGKYYDRAPVVNSLHVGALMKKPRTLIQPTGGILAGLCVPVFAVDGKFVGVSTIQSPSQEELQGARGGSSERMYNQSLKILPAAELAAATKRAQENPEKPVEVKPAATVSEPAAAPAPAPQAK